MSATTRFSLLFGYLGDDGHRDELFGWVLRWWQANFPDVQTCTGRNFDSPFHRGKARNDAATWAERDLLIIADADTVPEAGAVREGLEMVAENRAPWVIPYGQLSYYNLTEDFTREFIKLRPEDTQLPVFEEDDWDHQLTAWAGVLILPKIAFQAVGGYDERFIGWGGEDNAFQLALDKMVGTHARVNGSVAHLWHPRGDASFEQPHWPHNEALLRRYRNARTTEQMREVFNG